ncbi:tryptophan synthase subunit alpha [Scytonema sp. UIC 10036]|uniref:tryptophan synthase subunit alpha n=1 Tax=Scytonema sp. UIC 10036 TaxID=2304196 RepID=UPI0012DAE28B|nr:tryptophan synthase subunit alpha [Scytonema sp. UIC 10036]MUG98450.1 tryptophan synthase subunit alpha [Scytonema sp. UIC 10036]
MKTLSLTPNVTTTLEKRIVETRRQKDILLMSHVVIGYPSFDSNRVAINSLVNAGVELIELQFPFSEPIADGPVLIKANQEAVANGATVNDCFQFAREITKKHPRVLFLITTYYNILFKYGVKKFLKSASKIGIAGVIIPDLPPEEATEYVEICKNNDIAAIFLLTPKTRYSRVQQIAGMASGMVYCVARAGVTGDRTNFSEDFDSYIQRVREATSLPIGVGFGIQTKEDIEYLKGRVDIAVIGTQAVKLLVEKGAQSLGEYMRGLRSETMSFTKL